MKKHTIYYQSKIKYFIGLANPIWVVVFVAALFQLSSCNFNFPEEKQENAISTSLDFHYDTGTRDGIIDFYLANNGNTSFRVIVYPIWLKIKKFEGHMNNGHAEIPFEFVNVDNYAAQGVATGYMYVRINNNELYRITISYGNSDVPTNGQVPMYCSVAELDFGTGENRSFSIMNQGQVDQWWSTSNIPSWLELSQINGPLQAGISLNIQGTVKPEGLAPGEYSQIIYIESTNPQLTTGILVKLKVENQGPPVNQKAIRWIDGTLKDALYCKKTDYLYLLTQAPNRLLVKTPESDSLYIYPLDKVPNCIDITTGGDTIVVGYNQAVVDLFNARTIERLKSYETDCVPFDIVFGDNGWCYLAPDEDQRVYFYSLNLKNGVTYRSATQNFYEKSVLRKMPGKPVLYVTRPQLSPSGLLIVNIKNGAANDTVPSWHESTGGNIWISDDGKKIYGSSKKIYRTPEYTTDLFHLDLPGIGSLDVPRQSIQSLDFCKPQNCLFAVGSDYFWSASNASTIYQLNETSYMAEKSVKVKNFPGTLNSQNNSEMDVFHVFSNSGGTKLYALKNVRYDLQLNKWAIEIIDLPLK